MRGGNTGKAGRSDPVGLIGWVFADMLLALVIVFMGTQPGDPSAGVTPTTTTTTTTTPAPTTTTTPPTTTTTIPRGVDREYICIRVPVDPARLGSVEAPGDPAYLDSLAAELAKQLDATGMKGREAGVVLTFGVSQTPGPGRSTADAYNAHVLPRLPGVFSNAAVRGFWDGAPGQNPSGSVMVNLYPFTDTAHPPAARGSSRDC